MYLYFFHIFIAMDGCGIFILALARHCDRNDNADKIIETEKAEYRNAHSNQTSLIRCQSVIIIPLDADEHTI